MPLHDNDDTEPVTLPDGRVIRDLTDDEYAATYQEPGTSAGHEIPADVLAQALRDAQ